MLFIDLEKSGTGLLVVKKNENVQKNRGEKSKAFPRLPPSPGRAAPPTGSHLFIPFPAAGDRNQASSTPALGSLISEMSAASKKAVPGTHL